MYYELNEEYTLEDYAYQGNKLHITESLHLDCKNNCFVLHKLINDDQWCETEENIPQNSEGFDIVDRIEYGKELILKIKIDNI